MPTLQELMEHRPDQRIDRVRGYLDKGKALAEALYHGFLSSIPQPQSGDVMVDDQGNWHGGQLPEETAYNTLAWLMPTGSVSEAVQFAREGFKPGTLAAITSLKNMRGEKIPVPETYYRGERIGGDKSISTRDDWNARLFASSNRRDAELYAGSAGVIHEIKPKPDAKILYEGTKEFRALNKGNKAKNLLDWASDATNRAEQAGYDAVWFKRQGDVGTAIINRHAFDLPDNMINTDAGITDMAKKNNSDKLAALLAGGISLNQLFGAENAQ